MNIFKYENYDHYLRRQKEHEWTKDWTSGKSYNGYIDAVKTAFPNAKKILCIGARDASEVMSFRKSGYDAIGIDLFTSEPDIVKIVDMQEMDNHFSENEFDIIFSCHSLEHAFDPIRVLKSIKRIASQGSFLILPNSYMPTGKDPIVYNFMDVIRNDPNKAEEVSTTSLIPDEFSNLVSAKLDMNFYKFQKDRNGKDHEHWIGLSW